MKRNAVEAGQRARLLVVADDERDLATQLAGLVALQQVGHAVHVLRDEERDLRLTVRVFELPVHV